MHKSPMNVPIDVWRILDAAANRSGEGLRVIEEYVRLHRNDAFLTQCLKDVRHELAAAVAMIPEHRRLMARDTLGDVGTAIGTPGEYQRESIENVVRASFKRTQEALRTLEEYGKLLASEQALELVRTIERLRYRLYTVEKGVLLSGAAINRLQNTHLYLLVTSELCETGLETTVREAVAGGVGIVQLREKTMPDRDLVELARSVRKWTREGNSLFIMNDRPDFAVLADADGVHVGQEELTVRDARRIVGPDRLIGVSTHSIEQARQAILDGADYIGVGPTFSSSTKSFNQFAGLEFVRAVANEITLPWFAIGGIDSSNIPMVRDAGATRMAVSAAVCRSTNPRLAATELHASLRNT